MLSEAELHDIKSRPENHCGEIAAKWVHLRRSGGKQVGPCPLCCKDTQSRRRSCFEILDGGLGWGCAKCHDGGDVLRLVMRHEGLDFHGAVEWLGGSREINPEVAARRERERKAQEEKREADSDRYRQKERGELYGIWKNAQPLFGTAAQAYLEIRGISAPSFSPFRLRCIPEMPYYHGTETSQSGRKGKRVIHRGPAMVAPILGNDGRFAGLHFTYLDLTKPNGKAAITDPDNGEALPAKKVRGSKAAGHIDLIGPQKPKQVVIGEGIETVLTVWFAMCECGIDISETAFWSAVDLGNLGGPHLDKIAHPTARMKNGRAIQVPGILPDLSKPGIVMPKSADDIVLLGDGDSDPETTQCAVFRGQQRYSQAEEGCSARIVRTMFADAGADFNDMVRG